MSWEKIDWMGMPVGEMYINGQYLYVSTEDGLYRLLIASRYE